jgi:L-threonylcarbamoyladenylate synthase
MRRISIEDPNAVAIVTDLLDRDAVVVFPTDTIYGLSAPIARRVPYERIMRLKGCGPERRFIYLASSIEMVARYARWGCTSEETLRNIWPAALTAILPSSLHVPEWVGDTVALRVPESDEVRRVIDAIGQPILSTSANRAGEPPVTDVDTIDELFSDDVELIVVGRTHQSGVPSTIVDFSGSAPRVIRRGGYAWPTGEKPSK